MPKRFTWTGPQLTYITDTLLKLKLESTKINIAVIEIMKQLPLIHFSLLKEVNHSGKLDLGISILFQLKYPFQNPKTKKGYCPQSVGEIYSSPFYPLMGNMLIYVNPLVGEK